MKLDPGMHIGMHLVFFGKAGVTKTLCMFIMLIMNHQFRFVILVCKGLFFPGMVGQASLYAQKALYIIP
jgi:hypothetical protein